jgi:hypothetical protein
MMKENEEWTVNNDARTLVSNYVVFKATEATLIESNRGDYLVINCPDSKYLHKTEDSARRGQEGLSSFVGRIGVGEFKEEVLVLSTIEKSENFDELRNQLECLVLKFVVSL